MPRNFIPGSDAGLLGFSRNFAAGLLASWEVLRISWDEVQQYAALREAYAQAYRRVKTPETRGPLWTARKDEARKQLIAATRRAATRLRACREVSDLQLRALGLSRKKQTRRKVPVPQAGLWVDVESMQGRRVTLRLQHERSAQRRNGRPPNVAGAQLFYHVGEQPPTDVRECRIALATPKTRLHWIVPSHVAIGQRVWLVAGWYNPRGQTNLFSQPKAVWVGMDLEVMRAA